MGKRYRGNLFYRNLSVPYENGIYSAHCKQSLARPADIIAVSFYLLGVIPLAGMALVEFGVFSENREGKMKMHAIFVGLFLVFAHIAMIFGMLNPEVLGYGGGMQM